MTTEELNAKLADLEYRDEIRKAKARDYAKEWRKRNPHRQNVVRDGERNELKILKHQKALRDQARKTGDLTVYDDSLDQMM